MSINPSNFIEHVTFEGVDFSTTSSPFRSSDDDTKSDTPFGLSTHSSLSSNYSNKFTTHFDLDHGAIIKSFKPKPFKIIRATKEERQEMIKLSHQSKKIQKRVKAKERMHVKQEIAVLLLKAPKKYIPNGIEDPTLDDRGRRRLMQRLKNRMASQQTRDQRKKHISELEEVKMHLEKANKELNEKNRLLNNRNSELEELLKAVQNERLLLIEENNELKQRGIACFDPKPISDSRIDDPQKYFDFSEDKHDGNAPSPTLTRKNKSQGHYFNFFLGVLTICVARSGIAIQVGQETMKQTVEPSKISIQSSKVEISGSHSDSVSFGSSYESAESVSRSVQKKRGKKHFNEDINYYYSAGPQESGLVLYNLTEKVSLSSFSQLSKTPENYMIPTLNQKKDSQEIDPVHKIYEFKLNDFSAPHQQSYQRSSYDGEIYKVSFKNSTISHKNDYQHINSINEMYQALQDDHIEEETHHHGEGLQIARAGRASRVGDKKSRFSLFFSVLLSILVLCFVSYKLFKIGEQWSQLKKFSVNSWRKIVREKSENKMVKELESKVCDLYAKYFVKRSVETS